MPPPNINVKLLVQGLEQIEKLSREIEKAGTGAEALQQRLVDISGALAQAAKNSAALGKRFQETHFDPKENRGFGSTLREIASGGSGAALVNAAIRGEINKINAETNQAFAKITNTVVTAMRGFIKAVDQEVIREMATRRQQVPGATRAEIEKQLIAQRFRVAEATQRAEGRRGLTDRAVGTLSAEKDALLRLERARDRQIAQEREVENLQRRQITMQNQMVRVAAELRTARQIGTAKEQANLQVKQQELVVQQALLRSQGQLTVAVERELQLLAQVKAQRDRIADSARDRTSIDRQVSRARALSADPGATKAIVDAQKIQTIQRIMGDGGAFLFKIQAYLMGNYLVLNKIFSLFQFGVQYVVQLDQAFTQLQAITASTAFEMVGLEEGLLKVAEGTRFTAVQVAEAAVILGQAGFSVQQIADSMKSIVLFATATGTELAASVDIVTSVLSTFNMRAEETGNVVNQMTAALNLSKLSVDKLSLGIQYAGNVAADTGIPFDELVANLGTLADRGVRAGSTLGTGIRQLIIDLTSPTEQLVEELAKVGLTVEDINIRQRGFTNVLETMEDAGFGAANAFAGLEVRAASAFLALASGTEETTQFRQEINQSNAATEAAAVQTGSFANKLDQLKSAFGIFLSGASGPFLTALKGVVDMMISLVQWTGEWTKTLKVLGSALIALGVVALTARLVALVQGLNAAIMSVRAITVAFQAATVQATLFNRALLFISRHPLIIAATAVLGVIAAFELWERHLRTAGERLDELKGRLNEIEARFDATKSTLQTIDEVLATLNTRYATLSSDQNELNAVISSARSRLGQFGLQIDESTTSVEGLTTALYSLRSAMLSLGNVQIGYQIQAQLAVLEEQANVLAQQTSERALEALQQQLAPGFLGSSLGLFGLGGRNEALERVGVGLSSQIGGGGTTRTSFDVRTSNEELNATILKAIGLLDQTIRDPSNLQEISALGEQLLSASEQLLTFRNLISGPEFVLPGTQQQQDESREALVNFISTLQESVQANLGVVAGMQQGAAGLGTLREQQSQFDIIQSEVGTTFQQVIDAQLQAFSTDADRYLRGSGVAGAPGVGLQDRQAALASFQLAQDLIRANYEQALEQLTGDDRATFEQVFRPRMQQAIAEIEQKRSEVLGIVSDDLVELAQSRIDSLGAQIDLAKRQVRRYTPPGEVARLMGEALTAFDEQTGLLLEQRATELRTIRVNDPRQFEQRIREFEQERAFQREDLMQSFDRQFERIDDVANDFRDVFENFAAKIKEVNKVFKNAVNDLDSALANYDAIIRESAPGGALENRFSRVQVRDLEERQGALRIAQMPERVSAAEERLNELRRIASDISAEIAANQQRIEQLNVAGQSEDTARETMAEENRLTQRTNTLLDQRLNLEQEMVGAEQDLVDVRTEMNIVNAVGVETAFELGKAFSTAFMQFYEDIGGLKTLTVRLTDDLTTVFHAVNSSFQTFVKDTVTGTKSIGDAFKDMGISILETMLDIATRELALGVFSTLLGFVGGSAAGTGTTPRWVNPGSTWVNPGPPRAVGGFIRAARGMMNRDSVPTMLMPGEFVLRKSAVDAIGRDNLEAINASGNRMVSGSHVSQVGGPPKEPDTVNVYVITDGQRPQLGPKDIVAIVSQDMARGGPTRKLVKSIQLGAT